MTLAILGTGGHAKSVYDIVKNKKKTAKKAQKNTIYFSSVVSPQKRVFAQVHAG